MRVGRLKILKVESYFYSLDLSSSHGDEGDVVMVEDVVEDVVEK